MLIKNFDALNSTPQRKICLELIEAAFSSIQPENIIQKNISLKGSILTIHDKTFNLQDFERIFLVGFGKGSAGISKNIENILGDNLTKGYVIDLEQEKFTNIDFTQGTHPLPSQANLLFTKKILANIGNLNENDLVFVIISGGGSALFVNPYKITLDKFIEVNKTLLKSGANITEENTVRKHLDIVKGGGLAKIFYPARIISIIASDVPGNDLSAIASGPTVRDETKKEEALEILKKYNLVGKLNLLEEDFLETPKEDRYFINTTNILLISNQTALFAMQEKAKELGINAVIFSDKFQGEAKLAGKELIDKPSPNQILLAGGETTVKVLNSNGKGGRNQELVLGALPYIDEKTTLASFASDGWDNTEFAGAIGDIKTIQKAKELSINPNDVIENNDSFAFFEKTGDGIITGRLPSNVSDLMIVLKM